MVEKGVKNTKELHDLRHFKDDIITIASTAHNVSELALNIKQYINENVKT